MLCPKCQNKTKTEDTVEYGFGVYRRHKCKVCGYRFSTEELFMDDKILWNEVCQYKKDKYKMGDSK